MLYVRNCSAFRKASPMELRPFNVMRNEPGHEGSDGVQNLAGQIKNQIPVLKLSLKNKGGSRSAQLPFRWRLALEQSPVLMTFPVMFAAACCCSALGRGGTGRSDHHDDVQRVQSTHAFRWLFVELKLSAALAARNGPVQSSSPPLV